MSLEPIFTTTPLFIAGRTKVVKSGSMGNLKAVGLE